MSVTAYSFHLLEEYFGGTGFSKWFSDFFQASLSNQDFLIINGIFWGVILFIAVAIQLGANAHLAILSLGVLFFGNACAHLLVTIYTMNYSPGVISGIVLYFPLGMYIFRNIYPKMTSSNQLLGILLGIGIQILVNAIAQNI